MSSNLTGWLAALKAAGKGGIFYPQNIDRDMPFATTIALAADYSTDVFAASLRLLPDSSGATLADFGVVVGSYSGGVTNVTFSLTQEQAAALPSDADGDGLTELAFDILRTPSGGSQGRLMGFGIYVVGKVTSYGS